MYCISHAIDPWVSPLEQPGALVQLRLEFKDQVVAKEHLADMLSRVASKALRHVRVVSQRVIASTLPGLNPAMPHNRPSCRYLQSFSQDAKVKP